MTTTAFGFALPLKYDDLEKGQLVLASPGSDRYFGVVTKFRNEWVLATLLASDGQVPGGLDLANCASDLWFIPGTLEIEPAGSSFPVGARGTYSEGFFIDAAGDLLAAFLYRNDFGQKERFSINLMSGEHSRGEGSPALVGDVKFFIRQEGRKERLEPPS